MRLNAYYRFIGRTAFLYGLGTVCAGFLIFVCDFLLAAFLQRFFIATGMVSAGNHVPLSLTLGTLNHEAAILISLALIRGGVSWLNGWMVGKCQVTTEVEKRHAIAKWAIMSGGQEVGKIMTYFNDIVIGTAASIGNVFYLFSRFIMAAGIMTVLMFHSIQLSLIVIGIIVLFSPVQILIDKIISRNSSIIQSSFANSVSRLARAVKNNLFLTLHGLTEKEIDHINDVTSRYGRSSVRYYSLNSLRSAMPQVLGLIAVVVIASQGARVFGDNPGVMVAFLYMVLRLFLVLSDTARVSGNLRLNLPRVKILWDWQQAAQKDMDAGNNQISVPAAPSSAAGFRVRGLSFSYASSLPPFFTQLDADIPPGSITLVTGASGSGKTSLLYLLIGLLRPVAGAIEWQDRAGGTFRPLDGRLPVTVSYVGAEPFFVAGTIRDQIMLGQVRDVSDSEMRDVLSLCHAEFALSMPGGLDYVMTEQGGGLSAGQRQRLALARALLRRPSVLLLDEATANLDPETEAFVVDTIKNLRGAITILVISHRLYNNLNPDQTISLSPSTHQNKKVAA